MGKITKVLSCLVVIGILMSVVPWAVMAQDVSNSIAESKHIQEQAAAKEFRSQVYSNGQSIVPFFSQRDTRWKDDLIIDENGKVCGTIGNKTNSLKPIGCAMTCTAMILKYYGVDTDPKRLNAWLNKNKGHASGGNLKWVKPAEYAKEKGIEVSWVDNSKEDTWNFNRPEPKHWKRLDEELSKGYPVIVKVWVESWKQYHWVLVTGKKGSTYYINDPWDLEPSDKNLSAYRNTFYGMRFYRGPINTIAVVSTYNTILDDLDELVSKGKIPGYDLYTDSNIDDLWTNLDRYKILLIDEDCMFEWTNPCNPDCNKPIPVTTVGSSFYNHKTELKNWVFKGGRLFSTDQNDISPDYLHNVWWTWLPDELQVESNEYPSDYPEIGYGHYPDNLTVVYDPWIFSTPNEIDITKVAKEEAHGRFTKYPGYQALVRDKSDGDVLEIYRTYGKGIVVLSHLEYETADPYDVDYIENEIFGLERKDVSLELYIEDANKEVLVNKAPGDLIDIIAQLKNGEKEDLDVNVTIQVPADFELKTNFTRNDFTDMNEIAVSSRDLGGGKYEITTLVKSGKAKQVVWRFKIPDIYPYICFQIKGDVKVEGIFCDGDQVDLAIVEKPTSIIVTNRKLLFEKYGDKVIKGGSDDVLKLLRELYFLSDWRTYTGASGIVYYVDHYNETAKNWDQNVDYTDETTANRVANIIDDYIEEWGKKSSPEYLMIVGGDEVIPFYKIKNPKATNKEVDFPWTADPIFEAYRNGYYVTDLKYADLDDKDWKKGEIDLAVARIVGFSAEDMKKLIKNGILSPVKTNNAIVASAVFDTDWVVKNLEKKGLNIDMSLVESSKWTKDDLLNAMKKDFSILAHFTHSEPIAITTPKGEIAICDLADEDIKATMQRNRPFITTAGCYLGIIGKCAYAPGPGQDPNYSFSWRFINNSASGYLSSTATVRGSILPLMMHGEKLFNDYYNKLITGGTRTNPVGIALKDVIRDYNEGVLWDGPWEDSYDTLTVTEFHLYGIPWMTIDPEISEYTNKSQESNPQLLVNVSKPKLLLDGNYSRIIEVNVTGFNVSKVDGYDLIEVNGSEYMSEFNIPVLPMVSIPILLPKNSSTTSVSMVYNISTSIGYYNVPCVNESNYTSCYVTGFFPTPIYVYDISDFDDYKKVRINLALAQYNPQTNETILYNYTKLQLTYQTSIPIAITDFSPDKIEYTSGDTINASVTVENVGSDDLTNLKANLSLKDMQGRIVASNEKLFDIASGESKTIYVTLIPDIPHGVYLAEMNILGSGALASSSNYLTIKTGEIVNFTCPSEVEGGDLANFTISLKNGYQTSVEATGVVYIYDKDNIKVGEIYSAPIQIPANSIYDINISWDTTGREIGNYTASAVVLVESELFGPEYCIFKIKQKPILHTDLPNVELVSADPTVTSINVTSLNLSEINETYKPEGITSQYAYMINSTGAGNFTLKFTNISGADSILVYKIDPSSVPPYQWILLDATTTADTVTFTMEVGDPPVVFGSGVPPARVPTLTPIGLVALVGLLSIVAISKIRRRKN